MTEHRDDDLTAAFHRLRASVRQQVPAPASAALRAAATRQLRVRRTTVGVLAAAAVAAVALGGAAVLQPSAAPPVSPADPPSGPVATPVPSPRPLPLAPEPFADVDWREVTIELPEHDGCPSGAVEFVPETEPYPTAYGPAEGYPRISLDAGLAAYGDLTGDGRAEAVLGAYCGTGPEESYDGEGQLLVVHRDPDGTLRALGWAGPRGAIYQGTWIARRDLYVEAHPWHGETFEWTPGTALRYRWDGTGFEAHRPAPEYPQILPSDQGGAGPPVQLGPVAAGLGCPDGTVQFGRAGAATLDDATYHLAQPGVPSSGPHLLDLDQTGERLLVLAIQCTRDATTTGGLGIFEIGEDGFGGVSVLTPPESWRIGSWETQPPGGVHQLVLQLDSNLPGESRHYAYYRWNGTDFQLAD